MVSRYDGRPHSLGEPRAASAQLRLPVALRVQEDRVLRVEPRRHPQERIVDDTALERKAGSASIPE